MPPTLTTPEVSGTASEDGCSEGVLRELIGYRLKRAYIRLQSAAQEVLSSFGLRVLSFSCLAVIVRNPGISPSDLSVSLRMERPNIVVLIDELETLDLVSRTPSTTDRRRVALNATIQGRRLHDKAAKALLRNEDDLLSRLSAEERGHLSTLLQKIEEGEAPTP